MSGNVETIKSDSRGLRGQLDASLVDAVTGGLRDADTVLIKYHGSYQQDDRDLRDERRDAGLEPAHSFMIRTRTPGGVLSATQWLQLDAIATRYATRGLRITTRQALQLHGVVKTELKATMQAINAALIDTLAACGDVNRNVAVAAHLDDDALHTQLHALAAALSEHLLPSTRSYYELWLDEAPVAGAVDEPIYGLAYLPRKFKIAFAAPPYNDVDVFAQDLGFIAVIEAGALVGFNVSIGGGMGASHGDAETYPRIGDVVGFIPVKAVNTVAEAVVTTQRDWGNRAVRKRARLKYTIDDRGLDAVVREVERRAGIAFAPARDLEFAHNADRFGWFDIDDSHANLGLRIVSGRIDDETAHLQSGMRKIARALQAHAPDAGVRLTANQNLLLVRVPHALRSTIDTLLATHGLDTHTRTTPLQQRALACVALPTCGLAMAEAERYLPALLDRVQALLDTHGLGEAPIHLRVSGCPNGCSRPYLGEIALIGKAPGRYNLMLGADHRGQRLNTLHAETLDEPRILSVLDGLFARYAAERSTDEGFGDFLLRVGIVPAPRRSISVSLQTSAA